MFGGNGGLLGFTIRNPNITTKGVPVRQAISLGFE
jgi:hypothetical protein